MNGITSRTRGMLALALCTFLGPLCACGTTKQETANRLHTVAADRPNLTGVLIFRRFFEAGHHSGAIFASGADGRGERQLSHPPGSTVDSLNGPPGVTPDGSVLIFDRIDANGNGSLWRVGADGSGERRLDALAGFPGDGWPAVSPDGHRIAVARAWGKPDRYQNLKTALYVLRSDGSSPRLVADFGFRADVGGATWSPDGRRLVFAVRNNGPGRPADASALFAVSAAGHDLQRITAWDSNGQISSPAFSPDGRLVLFWIKPQGEDFGGDYFTVRPDGSHRRKLTDFPAGSNLGSARWSPDGKWIVFANTGLDGSDDLFVMHADGSHISQLTRTTTWESAVTWIR
jgi:Tol biopolymer transport system component